MSDNSCINNTDAPVVYVLSDSLGETAEFVARAAASQFNTEHIQVRRIPYINDRRHIDAIIEEAAKERSIISFTLVVPEIKEYLINKAAEKDILTVDILGPIMRGISTLLDREPRLEPGLLRKLDGQYFRKVEAIEFAVKYDDGKDIRGILHADIVLIGVSRTSKTPVSMYLAHKRLKAVNIPLVPEVEPPKELFELHKHKIIGLTISPKLLYEIRQERLKTIGLTPGASYANFKRILEELEYAEEVMKNIGCHVIDVTNRAVEETASKILEIYFKGERHG